VCGYAYTEVEDTSDISCEGTTPHKSQDCHDEHSTGWIRNVPDWIFARVKYVLVRVVNPKSKFFHLQSLNLLWFNIYTEVCRNRICLEVLMSVLR
jgi:hypothetical protein